MIIRISLEEMNRLALHKLCREAWEMNGNQTTFLVTCDPKS